MKGWWWGTIIAGGRILISCRFLPVWLAWPWPITSELCVTVWLPVLPKEWTEAGTAEHRQDGGRWRRGERGGAKQEREKDKTRRTEMRPKEHEQWGGRGRRSRITGGGWNLWPDLRYTGAHTSFIHLIWNMTCGLRRKWKDFGLDLSRCLRRSQVKPGSAEQQTELDSQMQ